MFVAPTAINQNKCLCPKQTIIMFQNLFCLNCHLKPTRILRVVLSTIRSRTGRHSNRDTEFSIRFVVFLSLYCKQIIYRYMIKMLSTLNEQEFINISIYVKHGLLMYVYVIISLTLADKYICLHFIACCNK